MAHRTYSVEGPHTNEAGTSRGRGRTATQEELTAVFDDIKRAAGRVVFETMFTTPLGPRPNATESQPNAGVGILFIVADLDPSEDVYAPAVSLTKPETS